MREPASHPPRPGLRRHVWDGRIDNEKEQAEFRARADTIQACGLIAEVTVYGCTLYLYATRRTRTTRNEK